MTEGSNYCSETIMTSLKTSFYPPKIAENYPIKKKNKALRSKLV